MTLTEEDAATVRASLQDAESVHHDELVTIHRGCIARARKRLERLDAERDATLRAIAMREYALALLAGLAPDEEEP